MIAFNASASTLAKKKQAKEILNLEEIVPKISESEFLHRRESGIRYSKIKRAPESAPDGEKRDGRQDRGKTPAEAEVVDIILKKARRRHTLESLPEDLVARLATKMLEKANANPCCKIGREAGAVVSAIAAILKEIEKEPRTIMVGGRTKSLMPDTPEDIYRCLSLGAEMFVHDPKAFVKMARSNDYFANGNQIGAALMGLQYVKSLFMADSRLVASLFKVEGMIGKISTVISRDGMFENPASKLVKSDPAAFASLFAGMDPQLSSAIIQVLGNENIGERLATDPSGTVSVLAIIGAGGNEGSLFALCQSTKEQQDAIFHSPERFVSMCNFLKKRFGVENFQRFNYSIIENAYRAATEPEFSKGKKIALIVLTKNDRAGAFTKNEDTYMQLINAGYCLVLSEAKNDKAMARRYFRRGVASGKPPAFGKRKYSLVMLAGHGTPDTINYNRKEKERSYFDLGDYGKNRRFRKGSWDAMLEDNPVIILNSCSTGGIINAAGGKHPISFPNPGNFKNMQNMVSNLAPKATVFAPDTPAHLFALKFDENGIVSGVLFTAPPFEAQPSLVKEKGGVVIE